MSNTKTITTTQIPSTIHIVSSQITRSDADGNVVKVTPMHTVDLNGRGCGFILEREHGVDLFDENGSLLPISTGDVDSGVEILVERRQAILAHLDARH